MRKIIFAVMMLLLSSEAFAKDKFVAFPTVGICTGDYVRYRSQPNTNADIWGRLHTGDKVIVEGKKTVKGELWYEISPADAQDTAYVSGKYIEPYFEEETQRSKAGKLIIQILQNYSPYKSYDYYSEYDNPEVSRQYDKKGWLVKVEAWNEGCEFGDISIGDTTSKLRKVLGEPDEESSREWEYSTDDDNLLTFMIKDEKITRMIYEE